MAKFSGKIGYIHSVQTKPGVFTNQITENDYVGDVIRDTRKWDKTETVTDDISISNTISVIANPYAFANIAAMRYVNWMGVSWKINNIEVQRPRLILSLGGQYHGNI